jgi:hypothetical protein
MTRDNANTHVMAHHQHQAFPNPEFLRKVFGMPRKLKGLALYVLLVDGGGHQRIDVAFLQVFGGCLKARKHFYCNFGALPQVDLDLSDKYSSNGPYPLGIFGRFHQYEVK